MDVDDADLDAVVVPSSVRIAGGVLVLTGVLTAVVGLQALLVFTLRGPVRLVIPFALGLGVGCVLFGVGVSRGRASSAVLGMVAAGVAGVFALSWFVFVLMNGALALGSLAVLPLSALSLILVGLSLKHTRRIEAARVRLRAEGLDAGL